MPTSSTARWFPVLLGAILLIILGVGVLWIRVRLQPSVMPIASVESFPALPSLSGRLLFFAVDRGKKALWSSAQDGSALQQIPVGGGELLVAQRSHSGETLVFATQEERYIGVWAATTGQSSRRLLFNTTGTPLRFTFSPDDEMMVVEERPVATDSPRELFLVEMDRGIRSRIAQDAHSPIWEEERRAIAYVQLSRLPEDPSTVVDTTSMIRRIGRDRALESPVTLEDDAWALAPSDGGQLAFLTKKEDGIQWEQKNWQGEEVGSPIAVTWEEEMLPRDCRRGSGGWVCLQEAVSEASGKAAWWFASDGAVETLGTGWVDLAIQEGKLLLTKEGEIFTVEADGTPRPLLTGEWDLPTQR
jgi:hypothetical protein